ncbi:phosphate uptake regulator PhoU [Natronospirillum operosum]|uniref:Phosphate uptake regulator PhoU n=1 Tax=Natronospirillum operosum TaxID=2759953 RepID=A0A4Z0WB92_9GAMM|nr:phosphate uptake regulator PhoU [Natronospirillum operosum]TGG91766.1 phosphate uptake regulator PhoU [Natronospirillum operosum]
MFRQLYSALTSENTLDRAFEDLTQMLEHGAWMFDRANAVLFSTVPVEEVKQPLYDRDRAINDLERSIRRKVMRHLTVNPGHDVAIGLALMSVAKDAERIGDYCKNVFEVGTFYTQGFHVARYQEPLDAISDEIYDMFGELSQATKDSDEDRARAVIHRVLDVRHQCDKLVVSLLNEDEPVEFHEAVAYSLLARHYKRVASHLGNVATAVTGNLEDLDFFPGE